MGIVHALMDETINATAAATSARVDCLSTNNHTVYVKATASGTATVKVEMTPYAFQKGQTFSGEPSGTAVELTASLGTKAWAAYTNSTINAMVFDSYTITVTGIGSNAADTVANVYVASEYR